MSGVITNVTPKEKEWTLIDSVTYTASSSGGSSVSKVVTIPNDAVELMIQLLDSTNTVRHSTLFSVSDYGAKAEHVRVSSNSITDFVEAEYFKSSSTLAIRWVSGSTFASPSARLYWR